MQHVRQESSPQYRTTTVTAESTKVNAETMDDKYTAIIITAYFVLT